MKTIILAGGLPSTLIEEDEKLPKPMAEIGGRPMLWHIMKQYSYYGCNDFIICTGYEGEVIKDYFMNFYIYQSDITVDLQSNEVQVHRKQTEDWEVSIIDTGRDASVLERLLQASEYTEGEQVFVSYGDCLSNIDINKLLTYHREGGALATFAVAHPTGRNEVLSIDLEGNYQQIRQFKTQDAWVNACSMVLEPEAFEKLRAGMKKSKAISVIDCLAGEITVQTYQHDGFWSPVETIRDKTWMETLWASGNAPWKVWED